MVENVQKFSFKIKKWNNTQFKNACVKSFIYDIKSLCLCLILGSVGI